MDEVRELLVQCLHRHSHTNRTLESLNNVDRQLLSAVITSIEPSQCGTEGGPHVRVRPRADINQEAKSVPGNTPPQAI